MTVAEVRAAVALALAPTELQVFDHLASLDHVGKASALVGITRGSEHPTGCGTITTATVWVVCDLIDPGPADAALDAALDAVLDAITAAPGMAWTAFERGVYGLTNPAYQVTVEVPT